MNAPRIIPDDLTRVQIEASDPAASAWVAANAGSGKTHVLAQRVIRLLLDGVNPSRILCITFTKAAAANMANRVFGELAKWTTLDDADLDQAIRAISNVRPNANVRAQARRLFATALETPGGLKVQTIHAFCTRLLQQFPFEADVAARFTVLDEAAEAQLLNRTSMGVLLEAAREPDGRARPRARGRDLGGRRPDLQGRGGRSDPQARPGDQVDLACGQRRCRGRRIVRRAGCRCRRDRRAGRHRDRQRRADPAVRMAGRSRPRSIAVRRPMASRRTCCGPRCRPRMSKNGRRSTAASS